MKLNILFGLLVGNMSSVDYYFKKHTHVSHTTRSQAFRDALFKNVPTAVIPRMACYICWAVMLTQFGNDIRELDGNNTYDEPVRNSSAASQDYTLTPYIKTSSDMRKLHKQLDADIQDRLSVPSWIETTAAVCLQILREVS